MQRAVVGLAWFLLGSGSRRRATSCEVCDAEGDERRGPAGDGGSVAGAQSAQSEEPNEEPSELISF
eukprot:scaffold803_cov310-Pinguiococcus_pyrenoidosus.AAC.5